MEIRRAGDDPMATMRRDEYVDNITWLSYTINMRGPLLTRIIMRSQLSHHRRLIECSLKYCDERGSTAASCSSMHLMYPFIDGNTSCHKLTHRN